MAFADQYTLATTAGFIQKVEIALVAAAIAVMTEAENTVNHSVRQSYAARVLANPPGEAALMARGVSTNATIAATAPTGASATDNDIQFTVDSLFTPYALKA